MMRKSVIYDPDGSGYGNEILYRMCAEEPLHEDIDVIKGKIWLIGRSYSAAIERKAGAGFKLGRALEKLIKNNKYCFARLDEMIAKISSIQVTTNENLLELLFVHKYLVDLFCELIRVENNNSDAILINKRALASKYLHFHAPKSVFIFDSIVNKNIRCKLSDLGLKRKQFSLTIRADIDLPYDVFVRRCIYYRDDVLKDIAISPRMLDKLLYGDEYY
jgi:hypothetical protein